MRHSVVLAFLLLSCGDASDTPASDSGTPLADLGSSGDLGNTGPSDAAADEQGPSDTPPSTDAPELTDVPSDLSEPADLAEPTDPGDEGKQNPDFFDAGQADPGGFLDKDGSQECEALGLAEQWDGSFDGEIASNFGDTGVDGTMSFEISCLAGKYIVSGGMNGLGENQPFAVKLQGTYNPSTKTIKALLIEGTVQLFWLLPVAFEGELIGVYDGVQFDGDWNGGNTDKTILDASGLGTWEALPK